jgi:hypothetical protein
MIDLKAQIDALLAGQIDDYRIDFHADSVNNPGKTHWILDVIPHSEADADTAIALINAVEGNSAAMLDMHVVDGQRNYYVRLETVVDELQVPIESGEIDTGNL